jgi:XTP/dITP diphosphohydrolase
VNVVLASGNRGKLEELARLLPARFTVHLASNFAVSLPPEHGETLEANAVEKARVVAEATGFVALGDDSGLEVDALGGQPGVRSARYAGEPVSDRQNIDKLLSALEGVPQELRTARFRCVVAACSPHGELWTASGVVEGWIGLSPRGNAGFGYDPVFVTGDGRTFAELSPAEKDAISHRGQALRAIVPELIALGERA